MQNHRRLAVVSGLLGLLITIAPQGAQADLMVLDDGAYMGHTYYLLSPGTWAEAEAAAVLLGGHLVTIDDALENEFVASRFGVATGIFARRSDLWIGLSDQANEGTFVWASGAPLVYENWVTNEPNDCAPVNGSCTSEDFVHMPWWSNGPGRQWNDVPASLTGPHGVVEVASVVPEASSLLLLSLGLAGVLRRVRHTLP